MQSDTYCQSYCRKCSHMFLGHSLVMVEKKKNCFQESFDTIKAVGIWQRVAAYRTSISAVWSDCIPGDRGRMTVDNLPSSPRRVAVWLWQLSLYAADTIQWFHRRSDGCEVTSWFCFFIFPLKYYIAIKLNLADDPVNLTWRTRLRHRDFRATYQLSSHCLYSACWHYDIQSSSNILT